MIAAGASTTATRVRRSRVCGPVVVPAIGAPTQSPAALAAPSATAAAAATALVGTCPVIVVGSVSSVFSVVV